MKTFYRLALIGLLIIGCYDNNILSPKMEEIDFGVTSMSTKFQTGRMTVTTNEMVIPVEVTPGALYSVQLLHLDGRILAVKGFKADEVSEKMHLDVTQVPNGSYDLLLLDVSGASAKIPVTINKQ